MHLESHFERLAPELLVPILTGLSDLESLDNLLKASPAALRVFEKYGIEIFEAVLSSGECHQYLCALIRIATLVRSSSLPPQAYNCKTFEDFVRHETTLHRYEKPRWTLPPTKLSSDVSAAVLRGLLALHQRISCLTIRCLKFYLSRFNALKPSHIVGDKFHFESRWLDDARTHYVGAWQQQPAEKPFAVRDIGLPTWVEEQRVLRAFWRVQLFRDLKTAVDAGLVNWPEKDVQRLHRMTEVDLYDVDNIGLVCKGDDYENTHQQDGLLEYELIWTVVEYMDENKQTIFALDLMQTKRDWPKPTIKGQQDLEIISHYTSSTYWFFYHVGGSHSSHSMSGSCSPLQHVSFGPFRRLGFAVWETERMVSYGLLYDPEQHLSWDTYFLAWKSILGREDIAKVEKENQKRYEEAMKSESDETDSGDESDCKPGDYEFWRRRFR